MVAACFIVVIPAGLLRDRSVRHLQIRRNLVVANVHQLIHTDNRRIPGCLGHQLDIVRISCIKRDIALGEFGSKRIIPALPRPGIILIDMIGSIASIAPQFL